MVMTIAYDQITFIIQGRVTQETQQQIVQIKKDFPGAPVIVSAIQSPENNRDIQADQLIISHDPGCFYTVFENKDNKVNNVNRQIVSTLAGLKAVKTPYAFKLRGDFFLSGHTFLSYFDRYTQSEAACQVFQKKLLACTYFSVDARRMNTYAFHPADFVFFGLTSDLINLFDIPLMTADEAYWGKDKRNRFVPEQYIWLQCLKKNGKAVACQSYDDVSGDCIEASERFFASNLVLLNFEQLGLLPQKAAFMPAIYPRAFKRCYTHQEWLMLYRQYVDPHIHIAGDDKERALLNRYYSAGMVYRLLGKMLALFVRTKEDKKKVKEKVLMYFLGKH